jgi:hypothetical protein
LARTVFICKYRKIHPFVAEPKWAKDGDLGFPVWETDIGNIAGVICMDGFFVESIKVPSLKGADVIVYSKNRLLEKCPWEFPRPEVWASRNKDEVVSFAMDTTSVCADIPSNALRRKDFVGMRQPYWYDPIVDPNHRCWICCRFFKSFFAP